MKLSKAQKLAKFFSSKVKFEAMKIESSKWNFTCDSCRQSTNIWELGGIRYKARGEKMMRVRCPKCHSVALQKFTKAD